MQINYVMHPARAVQASSSDGIYGRLNPITYFGFTQPYYSGSYGGIGGMPYMNSWQVQTLHCSRQVFS